MGEALYCLVLLGCIGASLLYFVPRYDRRFALVLLLSLLPVHLIVLYVANRAIPFVPSEIDTFLYAQYSDREFTTISDAVDVGTTASTVASSFGGVAYTHVLTVVHQFVGDSLFFKKALNVGSLWVVCFAWYAIALYLGGRMLARWTAVSCACLPTFWYYYCVVLRDLLTTAIHSILVASALLFALGSKRRYVHVSVMILTLVTSALLRPVTIYINFALLLVVFWVTGRETKRGKAWYIAALVLSALSLRLIVGSDTLSSTFAFEQKTNVDELGKQAGIWSNSPTALLLRSAAAVPLFFASEPTIASSKLQWSDPEQLRGLMNSVWFILGAPFAVVGVSIGGRSAIKSLRARRSAKPRGSRFRAAVDDLDKTVAGSRAALLIVLLYCTVWLVVCVFAADWTRWRLPAVPAFCVIAIWGYKRISVDERWITLAMWGLAVSVWRMVG